MDAFLKEQRNLDAVLSALPQGILCHDLNRRIFIFSKGAENLTGLSAAEVMGRDCHDIFRPLLCGDHCLCRPFQGKTSDLSERSYQTVYRNQSGVRKSFDVTVVPLKDEIGTPTGAMVSLMDRTRVESLERELEQAASFCGIVGQDHGMQVVYDLIRDVAGSDASVVITGESGTGKELVANAIHQESLRRDRLFVPVNCGALPEGTLESELFGHVKGAFTGAIRDKKGRFELADKGTLFLDEVSELKPALQVKLLRVLQEGTFEPVGSEHTIKVDVRIISATNKNLNDLVQKGLFREDLYYRLAVFPLELPPLRVRKNDIPLLAGHFLDHIREKSGRLGLRLSHEALEVLMSFDWPGNVRQLQNAIQYASIKCRAVDIEIQHLPPEIAAAFPLAPSPIPEKRDGRGKPGRKPKLDFASVENVLIKSGGNKSKAARLLQVGRATLYQFIHRNSALKRLTE
ncbi:MAG: hypothetical protein A2293_01695 [Elusimicrobia bacterium RIFOXYB2_FULL_49_7]|nr:MAG: hypothetical protein A2293_01695 [Elusimicrobia bacterium RIFOXYB2_FULL_49_7]